MEKHLKKFEEEKDRQADYASKYNREQVDNDSKMK